MGFAGLIFGAVAALWLLYLVPLFLNHKENGLLDEVEPGQPQAFSASVTIVRRGTKLDAAEANSAVVSTPLNRRAALRELADIDKEAARRRRLVLLFLVLTTTMIAIGAVLRWVPWWNPLIPFGLIVLFLVVARFSVRTMRRDLARRADCIRGGDCDAEETVAITVIEPQHDEHEQSVEISAPIDMTGSLWDPIPITAPTYVSKPLAPRTVRTIDLSPPTVGSSVPVTADAPDESGTLSTSNERQEPGASGYRRASGE